jgi:hypothetical protein
MARIPGAEDFGNVVARPANFSQAQTPRGGFGGSIAAGITNAASDIRGVLAREQAEAEAARKAADRAKALTEMQIAADDLSALHDEFGDGVKTGAIDKTKAGEEWATRAQERVSTALQNIPGEHRETIERDLRSRVARLGRGVSKAVTLRDQADTRAGIGSTLEAAQRRYLTDPAGADELVRGTLENLGPASGLEPDQIGKLQQGYMESSRWNRALTMVNAAKRDNKALDGVEKLLAGDEFAALDPTRRVQLSGQIEGFKVANLQRAEVAQRRAEAERERALREARSSFEGAQSLIAQGKVLSPEYAERVSKETAGTPYAEAFRESLKAAVPSVAFGAQPLAVQEQALQAMRGKLNQEGTNPEVERRVGELQRIHDAAVKDYADDPLPAALERGVLTELAPISTANLDAVVTTLGARVQQASIVQQQVGRPVSPLTRREAEQVGEMLRVLPVEQRAKAIATLSQTAGGPTAAALAKQVADKDKALGLAMGAGAASTTSGRLTSELILRGDQALRDNTVKPDATQSTGWRSEIATAVGDAYTNQEQRDAVIEAAFLIRAGLESQGGGSNRQAVALATGGLTTRNGSTVPLPYGMPEELFDEKLRKLTPADLKVPEVYVAGKPMPVADFLSKLPDAPLRHAGKGRYSAVSGGGLVLDKDGRPIVFEVR